MAQSGYTPISLYYSATGAAVPSAGNLVAGELALNTNDGKLYFKNSSGVVTLLAGSTSGPAGGSTTQVQYNNAGVLAGITGATSNGTVLTLVAPVLGAATATSLQGIIGNVTPAAGSFTTLGASSTATLNTLVSSGATLTGGSINGMTVGATTATTGAFTTVSATGDVTLSTQILLNNNKYIGFKNTTGTYAASIFNDTSNFLNLYNSGNTGTIFYVNAAEQMRLTSAGLAVTGTLSATGTLSGGTSGTAYSFSGSAPATSLTLDSSGNLGLGVTPSAWSSASRPALQLTNGAALFSRSAATALGQNVFYNSSDASAYIANGFATLYYQTSGQHAWYTAPSNSSGAGATPVSFTQAMTLDASGNLGIGTSSPAQKLGLSSADTTGTAINIINTSTGGYNWNIFSVGSSSVVGNVGSLAFRDSTNGVTRAVIDSSGNLLVGTTTARAQITTDFNGSATNGIALNDTASASGTVFANFFVSGTSIGSITRIGSTSAVAFNTTSDQRLKSKIQNANPVLEKLMQVQVRQYDWTVGDLHQEYGFIAQELEPVLNGVVTKGKTENDMWQLDYSKLTPHLVKAMQEQQALITQLTARITALETT